MTERIDPSVDQILRKSYIDIRVQKSSIKFVSEIVNEVTLYHFILILYMNCHKVSDNSILFIIM